MDNREAFKQWHFHFDFGTEIDGSKEAWDAAIKYANSQHSKVLNELTAQLEASRKEVVRLREALTHYTDVVVSVNDPNSFLPKVEDAGYHAREALASTAITPEWEHNWMVRKMRELPTFGVWHQGNTDGESDFFLGDVVDADDCTMCTRLVAIPEEVNE